MGAAVRPVRVDPSIPGVGGAARGLRRGACLVCVLALLGGCQGGYRDFARSVDSSIAAGDYRGAARYATATADRKSGDTINRVAYNLEAARAAQLAGDYGASREYFGRVHADVRPYLDEKAEAKITEAGATTLVNQTTAIYRATPVERIMATTLDALNAMAMGDLEAARVQLNLARDWQQDAVRRYGKGGGGGSGLDADAAARGVPVREEGVMATVAPYYSNLQDLSGYSDYGNPFASHLRGVFLLATASDAGDLDRARFELRRVVAMEPGAEPVVTPDLAAADSGGLREPTVWVYFLTGRGPSLEELRLDIPIPAGNVNYVAAAFPRLVLHPDGVSSARVRGGGAEAGTVSLASVDSMVAADFNRRLPKIVMQEVLSSAIKAGATYAASREGRDGWVQLAGILYQALTTAADLRSWRSLPKRVLVARVPTPADGRMSASMGGGGGWGSADASWTVRPGTSHIVVVSLPSPASRAASVLTADLGVTKPSLRTQSEEAADADD